MQKPDEPRPERPLGGASTPELLKDLTAQTKALLKAEVELAKAEVRSDVQREIAAAKRLAAALVCGLSVLNLLLVAVVLALAATWAGWAAALVVAAVVAVIGALVGWAGWSRHVKEPVHRTKRSVEEGVQWAKERLA